MDFGLTMNYYYSIFASLSLLLKAVFTNYLLEFYMVINIQFGLSV